MRLRFIPTLTATASLLAAPAAASAAFQHTVVAGESLSSIAATDGLTVSQLAAANGLSPDAQLPLGGVVLIPSPGAGSSGSSGSTGSSGSAGATALVGDGDGDADDGAEMAVTSSSAPTVHVVQPGETLTSIAANAGTTVSALAAANGVDPNGTLVSGTSLNVSGGGGGGSTVMVSTASSSSAATSQPVGSAAQGSASAPPYPTPERVSAGEVASIASANGVSPSLAQAIGWQESGFNNDLVSSADARGVMQILPGTWDWIQRTLTAGTPLAPASAADNVRGGVLLLHSLLSATGGDPALAAAGYFQGLPSVQQNGMFADTQQYVNSVMALRARFGGG